MDYLILGKLVLPSGIEPASQRYERFARPLSYKSIKDMRLLGAFYFLDIGSQVWGRTTFN